jgi:hypothetical protein
MNIYNTYNKWGEYTDQYTTRPPIDHCFISPENVFVESAHMDQAFIDEAKTMYASDHNATVFSFQILMPKSEEIETETETTGEETDSPISTDRETETDDSVSPSEPTSNETDTSNNVSGCGAIACLICPLLMVCLGITVIVKRRHE